MPVARAAERRGALFLLRARPDVFVDSQVSPALLLRMAVVLDTDHTQLVILRVAYSCTSCARSFNRSVFRNSAVFSFGVCAFALPRVLALSGLGATESLTVSVAQQ